MKSSSLILPILCTCASCASASSHLDARPIKQDYGTSLHTIRGASYDLAPSKESLNDSSAEEATSVHDIQRSMKRPFSSIVSPEGSKSKQEASYLPRHLSEDGDELHYSEDEHDHSGDELHHSDDELHHSDDEHDHSSHSSASEEPKNQPWGKVIGVSLLINVAALSGVIILIPLLTHARFCGKKDNANRSPGQMLGARRGKIMNIIIPSFACGALLAAAVFLIMPESLLLIEAGSASASDGHDHGDHDGHNHMRHLEGEGNSESDTAWKFGTAILGGFLLPIVLGAFFPRPEVQVSDISVENDGADSDPLFSQNEDHQCKQCLEEKGNGKDDSTIATSKSPSANVCTTEAEDAQIFKNENVDETDNSKVTVDEPVVINVNVSTIDEILEKQDNDICKHGVGRSATREINYRLCVSILLGDGFHNFADGIFVGTAFMICSNTMAYSIVVATLYHEIAQELADFFLLTGHGGLGAITALCINFVSGLTVMLGGIVVLAADLTSEAIGVILAIAGGVYIHIAASECVPRVDSAMVTWKDRLLSILMFALGAVPIGLVLLNHEHC